MSKKKKISNATRESINKLNNLVDNATSIDEDAAQKLGEAADDIVAKLEKDLTAPAEEENAGDASKPISLKDEEEPVEEEEAESEDAEEEDEDEEDEEEVIESTSVKLTRDIACDEHGLIKAGYTHYIISIHDFNHDMSNRPIKRNLLSLIKDNVNGHVTQKCYDDIRFNSMKLEHNNPILLSGLFIYEITEAIDFETKIYGSDIRINVLIPVEKTLEQIVKHGVAASYDNNNSFNGHPVINGYIMNFEDIKNILLDSNNIVYKSPCVDVKAIYDWGHGLYRTKDNSLYIVDEYKTYSIGMRIDSVISA